MQRLTTRGALILLLGLQGCALDEVVPPEVTGPSENALSIRLTATPDILTADGFSTSSIQATVRNENGSPVQGRAIFFAIASSEGFFADIGTLYDLSGTRLGGGTAIARTGASGIAQVIYETPPRTDATANQSVLVGARPVGTDASGEFYRSVRIELRSAEPRLFPQNPDNDPPDCSFVTEPAVGPIRANTTILFQSTSSDSDPGDTIVRYQWYFGDGTSEDKPDTAKVYKLPGTYTVTHVVTDRFGAFASCFATVPVI